MFSLVVCLAASDTDPLLPRTLRPAPHSMTGLLGMVSFSLSPVEAILAVAIAVAAYLVVIRFIDGISARAVIIVVVALNVLVLLGPPLFSTDLFSYQAYARMFAMHSTNPYLNGPHAIASDPIYPYVGPKWVHTPSVYGPLFTLLSALLAHGSIATSQFIFRLVAAISSLLTVWLIWSTAKTRQTDPVRGVALFGLNPLIVLYGVGGGHNDLLMVMLSIAGLAAILSRRQATGGALISLSAGIKLTGALLAPFALAAHLAPQPGRSRRRLLAGLLVAAVALAVAGFAWFGSGMFHMLGTLGSIQNENAWGSIPGALSSLVGGSASHLVGIPFGVIALCVAVWLLREVWSRRMDWIDAAGWMTLVVLLTAGSVLPWYPAWLMPLVALSRDRRLSTSSLVWTAALAFFTVAGYVPGGGFFGL